MSSDLKTAPIQAIVLAAGASSRFKSDRTKMAEKICGREMILYPTSVLAALEIPILMVVGYQRSLVEEIVRKEFNDTVTFIHQVDQLGTGHAIKCTREAWKSDDILVMNGDMPLVSKDIIEKLYKKHKLSDATISFVTAHHCDPNAMYGRVIQANDNIQIIEAKELEGNLEEHCCINAGIYLIKRSFLENYIDNLELNKAGKEWYITDLVKIASDNNLKVETITSSYDRIRGVNDFKELWAVEQIKKSEIIQYWMANGVRFTIAHNVHIDWDVTIGQGSTIESGVQLTEGTKIGSQVIVGAFSSLKNCLIGDRTVIKTHTVIDDSIIQSDCAVGPFAFIHGHSTIENEAVIGSFVEVNRSILGERSKSRHLTYLGDTEVGKGVNLGAGLITCNYNGSTKNKTIIKNNAFIGGNNTIVAPVTINEWAMTAAGSTITEDVPANALAIARERQINKEGYAKTMREKNQRTENTANEEPHQFVAAIKIDQSYDQVG